MAMMNGTEREMEERWRRDGSWVCLGVSSVARRRLIDNQKPRRDGVCSYDTRTPVTVTSRSHLFRSCIAASSTLPIVLQPPFEKVHLMILQQVIVLECRLTATLVRCSLTSRRPNR